MTQASPYQNPYIPPSTSESLRRLSETTQQSEKLRDFYKGKIQDWSQWMTKMRQKLETAERENISLRSKLKAAETENQRLSSENTVLLRNQQAIDNAIALACSNFEDTANYIAEATRSTLPTSVVRGSAENADDTSASARNVSAQIVIEQPATTAALSPEASNAALLRSIRSAEPSKEHFTPISVSAAGTSSGSDDKTLEEMEAEIERMLSMD